MDQFRQRKQGRFAVSRPIGLYLKFGIETSNRQPVLFSQTRDESGDGSLHYRPFVLRAAAAIKQQKDVVRCGYRREVSKFLPDTVFVDLKIALGEIVHRLAGGVLDRDIHGYQRDVNLKCINAFLAAEESRAYNDNQQESKKVVRHACAILHQKPPGD